MPIDEIEIRGCSMSFRCLQFKTDSVSELSSRITDESDRFNAGRGEPGFHDCDSDHRLVRGFYSMVVPFESVELIDDYETKVLRKRIETCEFFAFKNRLFVTGKINSQKILERVFAGLTGYGTAPFQFEFRQMSDFQDRLKMVKCIGLTNPKDREIRRARLAGRIETYTEYNVIDPRNHGIETVSGLLDTPLGPMTITVNRKGVIRLNVRRGFILTLDCLTWIFDLIQKD